MSTVEQVTTVQPNDTLAVRVRVLDVKPSDHKWYGPHDIINVEVTKSDGDLPVGLRFSIRRPHDGTADLRSPERRDRDAARVEAVPVPEPTADMTKAELLALADARGVEVSGRATKKDLLALLAS